MRRAGLAKRYLPGTDPIGRSFSWNQLHWNIVGVAGTMRMENMAESPDPAFYVPGAQVPLRGRFVVVRSALLQAQIVPLIRQAITRLDPTIALTDVATMNERLRTTLAPQRFRAAIVAALGMLALLLSVIGIYGVVAYEVGRQTREIGIRIALGEESSRAARRVVKEALRPALAGALLGIGLALLAGHALASLLTGVSPRDPVLLGATVVLTLGIAASAASVPAWRATRVDPLTALRGD